MNPDRREFLALAIQPARLSLTETAWFLGFTEHDVSTLVSVGLLKPLGHPPASGSKYFAVVELQALRTDTRFLAPRRRNRRSAISAEHLPLDNAKILGSGSPHGSS